MVVKDKNIGKKAAEAVRGKLSNLANRVQRSWAEWMSRITAKMSRRSLYIALAVFVLTGTAYNSLVLTGLFGSAEIKSGKIQIPKSVRGPALPQAINPIQQGMKDLRIAKASLDSLRKSKEGRQLLDSIEKIRPGLKDSLSSAAEMIHKH